MYTSLYRFACSALVAASTVLFTSAALAQIAGPPGAENLPRTYVVVPPTFQQLAYAHQTARTGSFVTPPGEAFLGVTVNPNITNAAVVASVVPGSPAETAGIRPGDSIVALANHRIDSPRDLNVIMRAMSPGAVIDVGVRRGRTTTARVQLGYAPGPSGLVVLPPVEQARVETYRR